jgi:hypothetical protein
VATLLELASELSGSIPSLSGLLARNLVNKALQDVRDEKLWSWMVDETQLICPAAVSTGTVAVVFGSNSVTFDAAAGAILSGLANPPITERQFRVSGGPIYSITAYNSGTRVATLDRSYTDPDNATASYQIYRCYYTGPADFLRWITLLNATHGYSITGNRLLMTREELDQRDPMRSSQGNPYYLATYKPNSSGLMQYEPWPHPVAAMAFQGNFQKRGAALAVSDSLPSSCDVGLVMHRATYLAARWADQNKGRLPDLQGTDWRFQMAEASREYKARLPLAKKVDNEVLMRIIRLDSGGGRFGPIDSNFAQSHDFII